MTPPIETILAFWFAPETRAHWFEATPTFDEACREKLGPLVKAAADGSLQGWGEEPRGCLALCLLLDQVPRNVWRGTPRAYAYDAQARGVADRTIACGFDQALAAEERAFVYLPFEHSENLSDQERAVALFRDLGDADKLMWAERHRDVIQRFGRFPHRNAILGRVSTPEEMAFLREPGSSF